MYAKYGFLCLMPHKFTVHETQNIFSFRNCFGHFIFFCERENRETKGKTSK
jgi:hypothetical protein